jgi:GNAT superfamily N-acetyltransferase
MLDTPHPGFALRHALRPGDLGAVIRLHGAVYAREHGFDLAFEAYVAAGLAEFATAPSGRGRLWLAERGGELAGCVAVVEASETEAQLRWFLVAPHARGRGLGRYLLAEAVWGSPGPAGTARPFCGPSGPWWPRPACTTPRDS